MRTFRTPMLAGIGLLLAASIAQAGYTFTNVADTTTAAPSGTFVGFDSPSFSGGTAAFSGFYDNNPDQGIFTGNGGALTTIAKTGDTAPAPIGTFLGFGGAPSISGGTVAFLGGNNSNHTGIFTGSGGALTTIAIVGGAAPSGGTFTSGQFSDPAISGGTVAFTGGTSAGNSGEFTGSGGVLNTIILSGAPAPAGTFASFNNPPSISGGTVAFVAGYNGNASSGIFTGSGAGPLTTIVKTGDPAPVGTFSGMGFIPISGGTVAFIGIYGDNNSGGSGVFTGNGGTLTTIVMSGEAAPVGTFDFDGIFGLSISGSTVAFDSTYDGGADYGIFTGSGGALTPIIKTGDALFGSTVTSVGLSESGLDASGDIAFDYTLSNGVSGVAIAMPVPEPASIFMITGVAFFACRRPRRRV